MLSWSVVGLLAVGVYGQRAIGAVLVDTERVPLRWRRVLEVLPLAIIAAVIVLSALTDDGDVQIDARAVGVSVAGVCAGRKLPMAVTVLAAAATSAAVRAIL